MSRSGQIFESPLRVTVQSLSAVVAIWERETKWLNEICAHVTKNHTTPLGPIDVIDWYTMGKYGVPSVKVFHVQK